MRAEQTAQAFAQVAAEYDALAARATTEIAALRDRIEKLYDERARADRMASRHRDAARDIRREAEREAEREGADA